MNNESTQTTARVSASQNRFWRDGIWTPKVVMFLFGWVALWLMAGYVQALEVEESTWTVVKSKARANVEQRDVANSPYKATRGTLLSKARLFDALAVLRNVEACEDWLHKCKQGKVVTELSAGQSIYYTVIDSPFILKDRDIYMQSTTVYDAQEKSLLIKMLGVENIKPAHAKRVRVLGFSGSWLIEQHGPNQIQLTYEVHMNPQVSTAGAANSMLATSVLETLINVDRLALRTPYLNSVVSASQLSAITLAPSGE